MTTMAGPRLGWRERWARQEDARRQRAHQAAYAAWQRRDAEHRHRIGVAIAFRPRRDGGSHGWLSLKRGEALYWAAGGVGMVEPPQAGSLRPPDYRELGASLVSPGAPALAHPLADTGQVAVTSQRVVFAGRSRREWAFAKLAGLAHTTAGQTLLLVTNRKKVSGVVPPAAALADFRLHLALALADASGQREDLLQQLEEQAAQHRQAPPPAPVPARTEQAPVSAWFSGGRLVAAAAAMLLLFCGIGTALASGGNSPEATAPTAPAGRPTTPAGSPPAGTSPSGAAPTDTIVDSSPGAAPAGEQPAGGDCAAYRDSGGWCVDGIGDYDCEGGNGNGPNYAPDDVRLVETGVDPFGLDRDRDGVGCQSRAAPAPPPPAPAPAPPAPAPAPPPADPATDPRFGTCGEAKDAGYGPYYQGQDPEYGWYRDADGDGVVCE